MDPTVAALVGIGRLCIESSRHWATEDAPGEFIDFIARVETCTAVKFNIKEAVRDVLWPEAFDCSFAPAVFMAASGVLHEPTLKYEALSKALNPSWHTVREQYGFVDQNLELFDFLAMFRTDAIRKFLVENGREEYELFEGLIAQKYLARLAEEGEELDPDDPDDVRIAQAAEGRFL